MPDPDDALKLIESGQTSRLVRSVTEDFLIDREQDIITTLIGKYRSNTLTHEELRGSIGEISGLRGFREHLEARIRKGIVEAEVLHGQGSSTGR